MFYKLTLIKRFEYFCALIAFFLLSLAQSGNAQQEYNDIHKYSREEIRSMIEEARKECGDLNVWFERGRDDIEKFLKLDPDFLDKGYCTKTNKPPDPRYRPVTLIDYAYWDIVNYAKLRSFSATLEILEHLRFLSIIKSQSQHIKKTKRILQSGLQINTGFRFQEGNFS